jgi:hypothetical protein
MIGQIKRVSAVIIIIYYYDTFDSCVSSFVAFACIPSFVQYQYLPGTRTDEP